YYAGFKRASPAAKELAYKSLVRSVTEYETCCWDPYRHNQINLRERIQKKAGKVVTGGVGHGFEKVQMLGWESLETRRRKARLCALFKVYSGHRPCKLGKPTYYSRSDHKFKIDSRKQRTDIGKYSFLNRTIGPWLWSRG
ncbi:hypothetical protein C0J52_11218, partial [Blattella germanica]